MKRKRNLEQEEEEVEKDQETERDGRTLDCCSGVSHPQGEKGTEKEKGKEAGKRAVKRLMINLPLAESDSVTNDLYKDKLEGERDLENRIPKGFQMMKKMGYKTGETLGIKENDRGLKEPIEPVGNHGKRGIRFGINANDHDDHGALSEILDAQDYRKWISDTKKAQKKIITWEKMQKLAFEMTNDIEIYSPGQDPRDFNVLWRSYVKQLNETNRKVPSVIEPYSSEDNVYPDADADDDIIIVSDNDQEIISEKEDVPSPEVESLPDDYDGEDEELDLLMQTDIDERIMRLNVFLRSELYYCYYCGAKYKDERDLYEHCPGITEADHE